MTQAQNVAIESSQINSSGVLLTTGGGTGLSTVGTNGQVLTSNGTTLSWVTPTTTSPGGSTTQVQYNSSGSFAGSSSFVFDGTNVGIGTSSPSYRLDVTNNSSGIQARLLSSSTNGTTLVLTNTATNGRSYGIGSNFSTGTGELAFYDYTASAERMRITSAGNVGIGTNSPNNIIETNSSSTTSTPTYPLRVSNLGGSTTAVGGGVGIQWYGWDAGVSAQISSTRQYTSYSGANLSFFNFSGGGNTGANTLSEQMRIDSWGALHVHGDYVSVQSIDPVHKIGSVASGTSYARLMMQERGGNWISFNDGGGTNYGIISRSGSGVSYGSNSDYRLKENVQPMVGGLAKVKALNPVTFTWKESGLKSEGFIAHELQAVIPDAVVGEKDGINPETDTPSYQTVDTSFVVATLVAAIKELKAEFDEYKKTHP